MRHQCETPLQNRIKAITALAIAAALLGFSTVAAAQGQSAVSVDFREQLGPVRDQGNTNLCASYAVADAISLELGQRVSALSVAVRYYQLRGGLEYAIYQPITGSFYLGKPPSVLKSALDSTLCLDSQTIPDSSYTEEDLFEFLRLHAKYRSVISPDEPKELINELVGRAARLFPTLDSNQFRALLSPFRSAEETLGLWLDTGCSLRLNFSSESEIIGGNFSLQFGGRSLEIVNEALDHGQIAIIQYNPDFLVSDRNVPSRSGKLPSKHASSIVGRKILDGEAWYLLRNSWGANCSAYSKRNRANCTDGHIWIHERDLNKNLISATYLKTNK